MKPEPVLAHDLVRRFAPPHALFWTKGSNRVQPSTLLAPQLPSPGQFAALLDGAWTDHGWREVSL